MQMCPQCSHDNRDSARFCAKCQMQLAGLLGANTLLHGRYQILKVLGCGGMGAVYLAEDASLGGKKVAVKENFNSSSLAQAQFQREAVILAHLDHPNLPAVTHHFIEASGRQYLVMSWVEGCSLLEVLEQAGGRPLAEHDVLLWADQLLDALMYCHSRGVIHRDIKPQNIILTPDGRAILVDFGLVKLYDPSRPSTSLGLRGLGTPEYAPPEQYAGGTTHTGPYSDVYSLGATLYHLLTGQAPPMATERLLPAPMTKALAPPRQLNPAISLLVEQALLKALALAPADRFASVEEMRRALLGQVSLQGQVPSHKKVPVGWIAGIGAALLLIVVALVLFAGLWPPPPTPLAVVPTPTPAHTPTPTATVTPTPPATVTPTSAPTSTPIPIATVTLSPTTVVTPSSAPTTPPPTGPAPTRPPAPSSGPAPAAGATWTRPADGMVMVYVPAGEFVMGSPEGEGEGDEHPQHSVYLDAFWIDRTEVTNAQYRKCMDAGTCQPPGVGTPGCSYEDASKANHPVGCVTWGKAQAYCAWAGARLPTEAEWEEAARGTDRRAYPWGNNEPDCSRANTYNCVGDTVAVGSYPGDASPYGVLDMGGNVNEWTADWYSDYPSGPQVNPTGPPSGDERVVRGGGWPNLPNQSRVALRAGWPPSLYLIYFGFRCASDLGSGEPAQTSEATPELTTTPSASATSSGTMTYTAPTRLTIAPAGQNKFSFNWTWTGSLKENEFFELRIWSRDGPHWGGAEPIKGFSAVVDMSMLTRQISGWRGPLRPDLSNASRFCASVAVITKEPYTSLSPESNVVYWNWP